MMKVTPESDGTTKWTPWTPKAIESTSRKNAKQKTDCGNSIRFSGTGTSPTLVSRHRRGTSLMERRRRVLSRLTRGLQTDTQKVGKAPREALDARRKATGVANGSIPADMSETTDGATHTPGISLEDGIEQYLEAVKATKGDGNRVDSDCIESFATHSVQDSRYNHAAPARRRCLDQAH